MTEGSNMTEMKKSTEELKKESHVLLFPAGSLRRHHPPAGRQSLFFLCYCS